MISIILPIRNEAKHIKQTLDSILNQNHINQGFEILIADGISDDGTREIIEEYRYSDERIHLIDNPEQIVSTGFNRASSIANGEIIIREDGHSTIDRNFIKNCLSELTNTKADCVGGATEHIASGVIGHSINLAQSSIFGVGLKRSPLSKN